jgi:hypothetical protein
VLGAAIVSAFTASGFDVHDQPTALYAPSGSTASPSLYAIVLVSPVLVYDYGESRPRRYCIVDALADGDPRGKGHWVGANKRLGTAETRRSVEAMATRGTRVSLLNASLFLDENPHGELEDVFEPSDVPLLLHEQLTILGEQLPQALPSLWSVGSLQSGSRDGWGCGVRSTLRAPPPPFTRTDQLVDTARSLVENLARLRLTESGPQLGDEIPF